MRKIPADQAAMMRMRVIGITKLKESLDAKHRAVWAIVASHEALVETKFLVTKADGALYAVLGETDQIVRLPRPGRGGDDVMAYMNSFYGLVERTALARFGYDNLRTHGLTHGARVELRRFSAYSKDKDGVPTVFLSNYDGKMWKCTGECEPTLVPNGEHETFFIDDDNGVTAQNVRIGPHGKLLDTLTNLNFTTASLGGISIEQQRAALTVWLFALAFPDLMPTKPLLILEGTQGSGKTLSLQLIQLALMGALKPLIISRNKEDAFGILLLRSPIALIDNMDTYIEWVADAICSYTTQGQFPRRKLYSDDEEVVIRPHAFVAVASKNPSSFRREDTVDRTIVIRLERRDDFVPAEQLQSERLADRGDLLGEYLWYVNEIVKEIRAGALEAGPRAEQHRMADFARLARVVGKVLGWEETVVSDLMTALQNERDCFAAEEDPLMDLLVKWISYRSRFGSNIGRQVSSGTLFAELETLAQVAGTEKQFYKSPKMLTQKLRSPHIQRVFDIEITVVGNQKAYKIWRKTDARLGVVPPDATDIVTMGK